MTRHTEVLSEAQLLDMDPDEFRRLVDDSLKDAVPDSVFALLRRPSVIDRYYGVLISIHASVEGQFAAKRADYEVVCAETGPELAAARRDLKRARRDRDVASEDDAE